MRGAAALEALFWQDEILRALYWLQGEGLAETVTAADLARFLIARPKQVAARLTELAAEGLVERLPGRPGRYRLTPAGRREGGRRFQAEFGELTRPAHGACGPGCWCQDPTRRGEPCPSEARPA